MSSENEQPKRSGVGEQLRRAREKMGRSASEMARELRLTVDKIEALEAEDYGRLPAEAYVKGYLRNYAVAVGLSPDALVEAYDRHLRGESHPDDDDQAPLIPEPERPLMEHPWRVAWVSLLLLVVVSTVTIWMVGQPGEPQRPGEEMAEGPEGADSTPAPGGTSGQFQGPAGPEESEGSPDEGEPVEQAAGGGEEPMATVPGITAPLAATASDPLPSTEPVPAVPPEASADKPSVAAPPGPAAPASSGRPKAAPTPEAPAFRGAGAPPTPPEELQILRVHTWAASWMKVADERGNLLLRRLIPADHDIRLYGKAPFQVKVGNAAGVQLYFEGNPLPPLGGAGQVVRLNVDAESRTIPESEVGPPSNLEEVKRVVRERGISGRSGAGGAASGGATGRSEGTGGEAPASDQPGSSTGPPTSRGPS